MTCGKLIGIPFTSSYRTASLVGSSYVFNTFPVDFTNSVKNVLVKIPDIPLLSELDTNITLASIPVDVDPGKVISYRNYNGLKFPVATNSVSGFTIVLTDQDGNELDFNFLQNWYLQIILEVNYYAIPPERLETIKQLAGKSHDYLLETLLEEQEF